MQETEKNIFSAHFPLGLGTTRFPITGTNDASGFEKSVQLVVDALECGIDYIDTAYSYSNGLANRIVGEALRRYGKTISVTVKSMLAADKSANDAINRAKFQLSSMGLDKASYFVCWTVNSFADFEKITDDGGIYDGAMKLKQNGIVDHICCSTHASPKDIIRIIDSGAFEGITVSYSLINAIAMQSVLNRALEKNIGIVVMNPLGGGIIPKNPDYFSYARFNDDEKLICSAIRFVLSHPAVNVALSGVSSKTELNENISALKLRNPEMSCDRLSRVIARSANLPKMCTGCNYCADCPVGIPIPEIMTAWNRLSFKPVSDYNRKDRALINDINLFYSMSGSNILEIANNPCVNCGKCERACTQKLPIIASLAEYYQRADKRGLSRIKRKERLELLLSGKHKIGLYPSGGYADMVINICKSDFSDRNFEFLLFNSNTELCGKSMSGYTIHSPDEIEALMPEAIIVCSYRYQSEISDSLAKFRKKGIKILPLHGDNDIPWVY
jgi:predicted aldo/keto reductase-like oxidoreductase